MTKSWLAVVSVVLALGMVGCGGGPSCSDKGKCKNDTVALSSVIPTCQTIMDGACGAPFRDELSCLEDAETCDSNGNGTADSSKCSSQAQALTSCCQKTPSACPG